MTSQINGVLLLNKPSGITSNKALQQVRRLYKAAKAGHTGTLDPMASGLLIICFGESTKFCALGLDADKEYIATIKLGQTTDTYDACGTVAATHPVNVNYTQIQQCLTQFVGSITQIPPIYSALKVNGRALYKYARSGESVTVASRYVTIYDLQLLAFDDKDVLQIKVACSKGTYIRSLAHDIGNCLGCGAHLINLVRSRAGQFSVTQSTQLDKLMDYQQSQLLQVLQPVDSLVQHLISVELTADEYRRIQHGQHITYSNNIPNIYTDGALLRLYYCQQFVGIARLDLSNQSLQPRRLLKR